MLLRLCPQFKKAPEMIRLCSELGGFEEERFRRGDPTIRLGSEIRNLRRDLFIRDLHCRLQVSLLCKAAAASTPDL